MRISKNRMKIGKKGSLGVNPLSEEQIADARFRAKDRAWLAVADLFDRESEECGLTYQQLADRIRRKKAQVHRWIDCSSNLTLESLGLLAEGLDADVVISLDPRRTSPLSSNYCHPAVMAEAMCTLNVASSTHASHRKTVIESVKKASSPRFDFHIEGLNA